MLPFFLLIILVAAAVANYQLHKWKRQQKRLQKAPVPALVSEPPPERWSRRDLDLDTLDWDALVDESPVPTPPVPRSSPAPTQVASPASRAAPAQAPGPLLQIAHGAAQAATALGVKAAQLLQEKYEAHQARKVSGDFTDLERTLPRGQISQPHRLQAMALLRQAMLHVPIQGNQAEPTVLEMEGGSYVPVATHPTAAGIALGYLAENMDQRDGEGLIRDLRGGDVGLLVVARNPQKPSVARLWKIQPQDL